MEEKVSIKPKLEVHVKARPVMEVPIEAIPGPKLAAAIEAERTIGRFRVQCGPLEDGKAVCKLTKEEVGKE